MGLPDNNGSDPLKTRWSLFSKVRNERLTEDERRAALHQLLLIYMPFVRQFFSRALPGEHEEISNLEQDLAVRFLAGSFNRADKTKGCFRGYLSTALRNMVEDLRRRRRRPQEKVVQATCEPAVEDSPCDAECDDLWRQTLVFRAMEALRTHDLETGQQLYTVLKLRMDRPELKVAELSALLSTPEEPRNVDWVNRSLFGARELLRELIRDLVADSLDDPTDERIEEELINAGLDRFLRKRAYKKRSE